MTKPLAKSSKLDTQVNGWLGSLARIQARYNGRLLLLVCLVTALLIPVALKLRMDAAFSALLPADARSVTDRELLMDRLGISSTVTIAVQHEQRDIVLNATERLVSILERTQPADITRIEGGVPGLKDFIDQRKELYLDLPDLKNLKSDLQARVDVDQSKASPFSLGLEDEIQAPSWQDIEAKVRSAFERKSAELGKNKSATQPADRGLFAHPEQPLAFIFLRTSIDSGNLPQTDALTAWVNRALTELKKDKAFEQVRLDLGGDLMDAAYETRSLAQQMILATAVTMLIVLLSVYLFYRSLRALPLLALVLVPPVTATFAFAAYTVEYLNTSTAFLMSIVIGNGINPSIIWLSRFYEELRRSGSAELAIAETHKATLRSTAAASFAAALAYGSLVLTDFRGFRDFGIVGGFGMVLCWFSMLGILPLLTLRAERILPEKNSSSDKNPYGPFFEHLALKKPRWVLGFAALTTLVAGIVAVLFLMRGPMEYDFRKLVSVRDKSNRIQWVNDRQKETVSATQSGNALVILAPSREAVPDLVASLKKVSATQPGILGPIRSIDDFLPSDQAEKLPILADIRAIMEKARRFASAEQAERVKEFIPSAELHEVRIEDLPLGVKRMFSERDGTLGRLIYSERAPEKNAWDAHYWGKWTAAVRSVDSASGAALPSTGTPMIFSDVLVSVLQDAPLAFSVAGFATLALILLLVRGIRAQFSILFTLFLGLLWMLGGMALLDIKFQFLNLLAFPIAIGNGVDYGVNVVQRFELELQDGHSPLDSARISIRETGGAVALCALTTIIGYLSIHISDNQALRSFAAAMALAETTCVLAALVALPAWLGLRSRSQNLDPDTTPAPEGEDLVPTLHL